MKRLTKFEIPNSKTLEVISRQKTMTLIKEKNKKNKSKCVQRTLVGTANRVLIDLVTNSKFKFFKF